jgi:FMN-dependent NADH-azoreductase
MKNLLRIDTSTRKEDSHSKDVANRYEKKYKEKHNDTQVVYRDLSETNVPHVTQAFIEAMYTPKENRDDSTHKTLALSDALISEVKNADTIVISTPMYNFGVPSSLKAYIDHISRVGETFAMDESGFTGLVTGKKLVIIAAYGALFDEMKQMDFVEPYLKSLFGFLGFTDIEYYAIEGTSMLSPEVLEEKKDALVTLF